LDNSCTCRPVNFSNSAKRSRVRSGKRSLLWRCLNRSGAPNAIWPCVQYRLGNHRSCFRTDHLSSYSRDSGGFAVFQKTPEFAEKANT
jgi:hypothetical protein